MRAIQVSKTGGPEVLELIETPIPEPGPTQALVKLKCRGVNFIDTYHRSGLYPIELPQVIGLEGAGVVESIGAEVDMFSAGARVAFAQCLGAYADYIVLDQSKLVLIPDEVRFEAACALMIQGLTAHYLARDCYPLKAGDTCLVHAAAGGVGLLLVQAAKIAGARVIGTVSTEEKAEKAQKAGADEIILYKEEDFVEVVRRKTDGVGVEVVYDSVGKDTIEGSLNCLVPRGTLVTFGQSSGPIEPIDPLRLTKAGSVFLTRPTLFDYVSDQESLSKRAAEVFEWHRRGDFAVELNAPFDLAKAAEAHRALEGRKTIGKVLLT